MLLSELEALSDIDLALQVIGAMRRKIEALQYGEPARWNCTVIEEALVSGAINAYDTIVEEKARGSEDFALFTLDVIRNPY